MMGMNQLPMTYDQITFIMNQNPMIKNMVYTLIKNPRIMNQMMNIINVLYYNPLILEQIKNSMTQEFMMNNQMLNMMNAMNNERMMMMNNRMMNNFEDKQQNDFSPMAIYFRKGDEEPVIIQCLSTDKVSEVIERYRKKSGDNDDTLKFIYNTHVLNPSITIGEAGITDNGNVSVVVTKNIMGG